MRVLVVDDVSLYRKIVVTALKRLWPSIEEETAPNGELALKKVEAFNPDLVLLDIELPDLNGLEVLKQLRVTHPDLPVVLISGVNARNADVVIEGLTLGAIDFIAKPVTKDPDSSIAQLCASLDQSLSFMMQPGAPLPRPAPGPEREAVPAGAKEPAGAVQPKRHGKVSVVAIGVSTGGPKALESVIPKIPANFSVPIVIVQHMPAAFTESLARTLARHSKIPVVEAKDGMPLVAGSAYIAPGNHHLIVERASGGNGSQFVAKLNDGPPVNSCRPSADVLFRSLAGVAGPETLTVVMTGMGRDGLYGVECVKQAHGYCLTQSKETCVVYGMPKAVDEAKLSDQSVPLEQLADRIIAVTGGRP